MGSCTPGCRFTSQVLLLACRAILNNVLLQIAAIKEHLEDSTKPQGRGLVHDSSSQPLMLGGVTRNVTKAELLSSLPSKPASDILVERFFESLDPSVPSKDRLFLEVKAVIVY